MRLLTVKDVLLAILSGLLLTASFPPGQFGFLAWVAFIPFFKGNENLSRFDSFRLGLSMGFAHYITLVYWVVFVMGHYGGLNSFISLGIFLLLVFYLSLYPAFFSVLVSLKKTDTFPILLYGGLWVLLEFLRARLFSGFPWCLLGYSQFKYLRVIQIADLVGVYGISFLIMAINVLIYHLVFKRDLLFKKTSFRLEAILASALFLTALVYGHVHKLRPCFSRP